MMRKILPPVCCLIFVLSLAGCSKAQEQMQEFIGKLQSNQNESEKSVEDSAVKYNADTTYHNSYLGFSYTVPKGWWLYHLTEDNFSKNPDDTADPDVMDISYGEDGGFDYSYIGLLAFANLQFSTKDNHLGFLISAETLDGVDTLEGYMKYFEGFMLEPDDDTYALLDSGRTDINGKSYERRLFEIIREESDNYYYLTLTRPVNNGYYLTIRASYWPDNKNAEEIILGALSKAMP